ncbi:NADPH-dependent ferric siderophore reductase, contains FAD-binding and SIP domains [Nonomuraea solani]|uniref:NADPH-dependent ferric siderophore reductase, contains FAD-binding and SIP domains n=1 Tax=Nonomuraea solani TaxID=1144553 RepID=A0A1H6EZ96_9ACTN|nr:siderophore-interacting protein [Nonomuraea solani]SEH03228.1 NADPH-dependent ferric siderophore reductase, contains FAD-binding and SIP domains [Nonomuraea solani]
MAEKPIDHHRGVVLRTEKLSRHMVRVVVGGDGLADFATRGLTDHYVKLVFPYEGVQYPEPFTVKGCRETMPRELWPRLRTYTVRAWDPDSRELTLDFVVHGDEGLAGPWAARAVPGDVVLMLGPGGGYAPEADAAWHLLVGDESALPAIAAALEVLPDGAVAHVLIEVDSPEDEQKLGTAADARITWIYRGGRPVGEGLVRAVRDLEFPSGDVHAFVHGEAGFVKELRRHLRLERGISLDRLSISGYWRLGVDDEAWREVKSDWNRAVEAEEEAAIAS